MPEANLYIHSTQIYFEHCKSTAKASDRFIDLIKVIREDEELSSKIF